MTKTFRLAGIARGPTLALGLLALAVTLAACSTGRADDTPLGDAPGVSAGPAQAVEPADADGLSLDPDVPDFTLPAGLGGEYTLSSYLGEKNVLIVFYRAWW